MRPWLCPQAEALRAARVGEAKRAASAGEARVTRLQDERQVALLARSQEMAKRQAHIREKVYLKVRVWRVCVCVGGGKLADWCLPPPFQPSGRSALPRPDLTLVDCPDD